MNRELIQTITRLHMEGMTNTEIDSGEWNNFVYAFIDVWAEQVSLLALEFWQERQQYKGDEEE